jgi:adenosine deaminase
MFSERKKIQLHVHMENTRRLNLYDGKPVDHQFPDLSNTHSISVFFKSGVGIPNEHMHFYTPETLSRLVYDLLVEQADCNVIYTEFKFNILHWLRAGLNLIEALTAIRCSIQKAKEKRGIQSNCILCFDRGTDVDSILTTIENVAQHNPTYIVGIDFAGNEQKFADLRVYKNVTNYVKKIGWKLTIHAGEFGSTENIWYAVDELGADRIGHGIAAVHDEPLMEHLYKNKIMLDISISMNVFLHSVNSIDAHPIKIFIDNGIPVSLNTDNPILLKTDMNNEYYKAVKTCGVSPFDLFEIEKNSVIHSFAQPTIKKELLFLIEENKVYFGQ